MMRPCLRTFLPYLSLFGSDCLHKDVKVSNKLPNQALKALLPDRFTRSDSFFL